jgi:hypothetical protein
MPSITSRQNRKHGNDFEELDERGEPRRSDGLESILSPLFLKNSDFCEDVDSDILSGLDNSSHGSEGGVRGKCWKCQVVRSGSC